MAKTILPTPEDLRNALEYDPTSGRLVWRYRAERGADWNTRYAEKDAFTTVAGGYRQGRMNGVPMLMHRAIWAIVHGEWPQGQIDHINGDRQDNRLANLRAVSQADNLRNAKMNKRNSTGHAGVYRTPTGKWNAQIHSGGKSRSLGTYGTFGEAVAARLAAEKAAGFHPNHGKR